MQCCIIVSCEIMMSNCAWPWGYLQTQKWENPLWARAKEMCRRNGSLIFISACLHLHSFVFIDHKIFFCYKLRYKYREVKMILWDYWLNFAYVLFLLTCLIYNDLWLYLINELDSRNDNWVFSSPLFNYRSIIYHFQSVY